MILAVYGSTMLDFIKENTEERSSLVGVAFSSTPAINKSCCYFI
jgi:hypothetical protein